MPRELALKGTVARNSAVEPEDTRTTKRALSRIGLYAVPRSGLTSWPDEQMFQAIKRFQKSAGLKADSIIKPKGATARRLARVLDENDSDVAGPRDFLARAPGPAESGLGDFDEEHEFEGDRAQPSGLPRRSEKPISRDLDSGTHEFIVKNGISVDAVSNTLGIDGIRYTVDWYALDKGGNVIPQLRSPEFRPEEAGGHLFPFKSRRRDFQPPFSSPHGYMAVVTIPPQSANNANSAAPFLRVHELQ